MPKVKANNILINYEESGNGEPVIFIPGLGGNTKLWYKQTPFFSQHFKIISIDNRGAGESDKPDGPYNMDMLAKDTKEFLDALGIKEKVNIVGASMGGIIAQAFIHNYPEMVKKLVLVCSGVSGGDPHYVQMENEYIQRIANPGQTAEEKVKTIIDIFYHPDYIKNHPEVRDAYLNRKVENSNPQAYFWQLQACIDQRPYYEWLKDIKCPVLIMHGEGDRVWKLKNAQVLKDGIGDNAELYIMKDAEHMFFQEKPEEFNAKLLDFLKK